MKENFPTKIIVTGGAGFIGSHLVDELVSLGYEVHVVDNLVAGKKEQVNHKAILHVADIRDLEALKKVFTDATYVFHLAALPRVQYSIDFPTETHDVNVSGTLNVIIAAKEAGVKRVIYAASSSVYGDQEIMPLTEGMPASPKSPYAQHKHIGELYLKLWNDIHGLETISLRFFNVYGPRQPDEGAYALVIARFLKQKRENQPMTITGDGEQTRDFTHVRDIVRGNILAMLSEKAGNGEVINLGTGANTSVNKIAELIGGEKIYIAPRLEPRHTRADNNKAKELLGWEPTISLEEGIAELLV